MAVDEPPPQQHHHHYQRPPPEDDLNSVPKFKKIKLKAPGGP